MESAGSSVFSESVYHAGGFHIYYYQSFGLILRGMGTVPKAGLGADVSRDFVVRAHKSLW